MCTGIKYIGYKELQQDLVQCRKCAKIQVQIHTHLSVCIFPKMILQFLRTLQHWVWFSITPQCDISQFLPKATTSSSETNFKLSSYAIILYDFIFPTLFSFTPTLSLFFSLRRGQGGLPPLPAGTEFKNMQPGNNWVTTAAAEWVGLNFSAWLHLLLSGRLLLPQLHLLSSMQAGFLLLYGSGRHPDAGLKDNPNITIQTHKCSFSYSATLFTQKSIELSILGYINFILLMTSIDYNTCIITNTKIKMIWWCLPLLYGLGYINSIMSSVFSSFIHV